MSSSGRGRSWPRRQESAILCNDYVFDETVTLIRGRAGHRALTLCGAWLLRSPQVMRREKLRQAFGFDHNFEQLGYRLWPEPE